MKSETVPNPLNGLAVRRATNADIPAIRAVLHAVRLEYGVLSEMGATDPDLDDIELGYFGRGGYFEVVEDGRGRILGCAGLYPLSQQRAELCKMYLERAARGRGLGKRLLENLSQRRWQPVHAHCHSVRTFS